MYFNGVIQQIIERLHGWKGKLLFVGGRMILIQNTLATLHIYTIAAFSHPKMVIKRIEMLFAKFLWGGNYNWRAWKFCATPNAKGGLGFRSLHDINQAFSCKLWLKYRVEDSLWASHMRAKYSGFNHHSRGVRKIHYSSTWLRLDGVLILASNVFLGLLVPMT